jgi:hypothetical protein
MGRQGSARQAGTLRLAFCWVTIAACLPYLALKAVWVSRATIGFRDPAVAGDAPCASPTPSPSPSPWSWSRSP